MDKLCVVAVPQWVWWFSFLSNCQHFMAWEKCAMKKQLLVLDAGKRSVQWENEREKTQCHFELKWFSSHTLTPNVELYLSDFHLHMLCVIFLVYDRKRANQLNPAGQKIRILWIYTHQLHSMESGTDSHKHSCVCKAFISRTLYFLTLQAKITYVLIYLHLIWIYGMNGSYVNSWNEG